MYVQYGYGTTLSMKKTVRNCRSAGWITSVERPLPYGYPLTKKGTREILLPFETNVTDRRYRNRHGSDGHRMWNRC